MTEVSEESPGRQPTHSDGGRSGVCRPCVRSITPRASHPRCDIHGIEINRYTVEFSRNRHPNHPHQNQKFRPKRPGVLRLTYFFALLCFILLCFSVLLASELIRPINDPAIFAFRFQRNLHSRLRRFPDCTGPLPPPPNPRLHRPDPLRAPSRRRHDSIHAFRR